LNFNKSNRSPSSHPCVIITTYVLVKSNRLDFLGGKKDDSLYWDYIIADEGHTLKNPNTDQHKAMSRIARNHKTHRILLTGTPIQNNMTELWALFDWATAGRLLGCKQRYLNQFAIPIEEGRNKNATFHTLKIASKANDELQAKLRPHFLQRMKNTEFKNCLPVKKELVVWLHLSDLQRKLYDDYVVDGGKVAAILSGDISSPLEAITWLKKLCDHPSLVSPENDSSDPEILKTNSSKLHVLIYLVLRLKRSNHRCLIFSPSTKMLDIMEKVLPVKLGRIDGSISGKSRQAIVDKFNNDESSFDALLLSTKAAGVGITLTGADRAIIFSPSWNPSDDSQAVDRYVEFIERLGIKVLF
jgi:Superfamily II DNA/RNA helicases, SNF2 family